MELAVRMFSPCTIRATLEPLPSVSGLLLAPGLVMDTPLSVMVAIASAATSMRLPLLTVPVMVMFAPLLTVSIVPFHEYSLELPLSLAVTRLNVLSAFAVRLADTKNTATKKWVRVRHSALGVKLLPIVGCCYFKTPNFYFSPK
ncbi:MAG: hypothetical protein LBV46_03400 [Bacteroidales bacterium]|nr:hypothetical protein [Bacteroidales bacterium]